MRLFYKEILGFAVVSAIFVNPLSQAGTTSAGRILMTVVQSLSITEVRPMTFAAGTPGAEESTINPGDENSSLFKIQGEPNMSFQIQLPTQATLSIDGDSSPDKNIQISQFASSPSTTGSLDANGDQNLYVGATRQALSSTQAFGTYSGTFQVTIIY